MRIYFIRHGQTYGNTLSRYIGVTDEPILDSARDRLKETAYPEAEAVFVSPMLRCRQTAEAIYPKRAVRIVDEFAECDFGLFENKNWKELSGDPEYQKWIDSNGTLPFPQGEDPIAFRKRSCMGFEKAVAECLRKNIQSAAMVVHGGTIMSIMERYVKSDKAFYEWHVRNGDGYEIEIEKSLWTAKRREIHQYGPLKFPFGEGHMHIFMNGVDYRAAVRAQEHGVDESVIHKNFKSYQERKITWLRDGGDCYGTSKRAMELAAQYGITYRTPVFAIHKNGHYGGIVGRGFDTMKEYHQMVQEVRKQGGHFIKIMISGIMDFDHGGLTEESLTASEITEMIHIAHEEGFPVMIHGNGSDAVRAAVLAGADSMEHGNFCDEDTLQAMADSETIWVPTIVTVKNLLGDGRFPEEVIEKIWEGQQKNLLYAYEAGVHLALGSDAGAYRVLHGQGLMDEYDVFKQILGKRWNNWEDKILEGDTRLKNKF